MEARPVAYGYLLRYPAERLLLLRPCPYGYLVATRSGTHWLPDLVPDSYPTRYPIATRSGTRWVPDPLTTTENPPMLKITAADGPTADRAWQAILAAGTFEAVAITREDTGRTTHLHRGPDGRWAALAASGALLRA